MLLTEELPPAARAAGALQGRGFGAASCLELPRPRTHSHRETAAGDTQPEPAAHCPRRTRGRLHSQFVLPLSLSRPAQYRSPRLETAAAAALRAGGRRRQTQGIHRQLNQSVCL